MLVGKLGWFDFLSIKEEFDVAQAESLCAALALPVMGIFTNTQEEKEGDQCELACGLESPV